MTAWASFNTSKGRDHDSYYIRFNVTAAKILKCVDKVYFSRTSSGNYLILEPVPYYELDHDKFAVSIAWYDGKYPIIPCNKVVSMLFLPSRIFDGRRCIVKRGKDNRAYICMNLIEERTEKGKENA